MPGVRRSHLLRLEQETDFTGSYPLKVGLLPSGVECQGRVKEGSAAPGLSFTPRKPCWDNGPATSRVCANARVAPSPESAVPFCRRGAASMKVVFYTNFAELFGDLCHSWRDSLAQAGHAA